MICAILALLVALIVQSTVAYFTTTSTARNVITTGTIDISLTEKTVSGDVLTDVKNLVPGDTVSQNVTVTNHEMPAYVRMKCSISVQDEEGNFLASDGIFLLDMNEEAWTYRDGWWYYDRPLNTGEVSQPLFTQVLFSAEADNDYKKCEVWVELQAQATQVANNGTDVFTAAGWPEP